MYRGVCIQNTERKTENCIIYIIYLYIHGILYLHIVKIQGVCVQNIERKTENCIKYIFYIYIIYTVCVQNTERKTENCIKHTCMGNVYPCILYLHIVKPIHSMDLVSSMSQNCRCCEHHNLLNQRKKNT